MSGEPTVEDLRACMENRFKRVIEAGAKRRFSETGVMLPVAEFAAYAEELHDIVVAPALAAARREALESLLTDKTLDGLIQADGYASYAIQGFSYGGEGSSVKCDPPRYVIRDLRRPGPEQVIWSGPAATQADRSAFKRQCDRERLRFVLVGALAAQTPRDTTDGGRADG